ncbi:HAD-IA family hydrolase [Rhodovulum sp. DZ06]|uniref:HAD-IA family hydrolase n=1 Tax=Rhodovulum sp. DZ06 TaxID=3425126 RepID=UPI003D3448C8
MTQADAAGDAPLRLAVFDMDGTLIDSQQFIKAAMARGFEMTGLTPPSEADILSIVGLSLPEAMAVLAPGSDAARIDALTAAYKTAFVAIRAETGGEAKAPLYPGAEDALARLSARPELLLGVATGKAKRGLDHTFASFGWGKLFHTAHCADGHPSKPHPSMLHACMSDTGVEARHAAMIGDTSFDMQMAKSAGMAAIGVAWGYHPVAALLEAGADVIIEDFRALDDALDAIWSVQA